MPTNLEHIQLLRGGLPQWFFAESMECCEKYKRAADSVKPPHVTDAIQLALMADEITYLAQSIRQAKHEQEQRSLTQAMKKISVEQHRFETESKATLEQRQIDYLKLQEGIFKCYLREREAIDKKLAALISDKKFVANLVCRGLEVSESAEQGSHKSAPTNLAMEAMKSERRKHLLAADGVVSVSKRVRSSQPWGSYFDYDSDASQEEDEEVLAPTNLGNETPPNKRAPTPENIADMAVE